MDVNRLLRHLFERAGPGEVAGALREKMRVLARDDAIIQVYNSEVRAGRLEPVEITSPAEAVALVLTPRSTAYAAEHLGEFSYVQVCALVNQYDG